MGLNYGAEVGILREIFQNDISADCCLFNVQRLLIKSLLRFLPSGPLLRTSSLVTITF